MAKINKRFCKLTREQFDAQLSSGGGFEKYTIVFITDAKKGENQIWHDNVFYGISKQQEDAILKYQSKLPDELTTPSKHGGLAAGVKVSDLKNKSLSELFDDILFEEINPTVKSPSASIAPKGSWASDGIYEVGAAAPSNGTDHFTIGFDRGVCTVVGQPSKNRAGAETGRNVTYKDAGLSASQKIELGPMAYKVTINYGQGDELKTSKGNKAAKDSTGAPISQNPLPAGSVEATTTIFGTYPYFCNGASASNTAQDSSLPSTATPDTKLPLQKWTDVLVGAKFASEASTGTRLEFYFPSQKNVTKVEFYNTVSGKWEVFSSANYTITDSGNKEIQGQQVAYKKLTTKGAMSGALQLRFTIADGGRKLRSYSESDEITHNGKPITDEVFRAVSMNSMSVPFVGDFPTVLAESNRPAGVAAFAVNFEPGGQSPLDARMLVPTKADLIAEATYAAKNYFKGMLVVVADDGGTPALYILKDVSKITTGDYSGWQRVDVGAQKIIQIINDLTTGGTDKALSAEQGKTLKGLIDALDTKVNNLGAVYNAKGTVQNLEALKAVESVKKGDVYNVTEIVTLNGKKYPADTNFVYIGEEANQAGTETNWDSLGGTIDTTAIDAAIAEIKNYTVNGKKISTNPVLSGADVALTGFAELSGSSQSDEELKPVATDTVNAGLAKLHKAILNNKESITASLNKMKASIGLGEDFAYQPTAPELNGKDVAKAIDFVFQKAKETDTLRAELEAFKAQFDWYEGE